MKERKEAVPEVQPDIKTDIKPDIKQEVPIDSNIFTELSLNYPEGKKRRSKKAQAQEDKEKADIAKTLETKSLIDMLMVSAKAFIAEKNYPEINPIQEMLFTTGLMGLIKKYNLYSYLTIEEQPEIAVCFSSAWYGYDVYRFMQEKKSLDKPILEVVK